MLNVKKLLKNVIVRLSGIGTYYYVTSPNRSVGASVTALCSLTLPKGTYVVRGMFGTSASSSALRVVSLVESPTPSYKPRSTTRWATSSGGGDFTVVLYKFDEETTITLQAYCTTALTLDSISIEAIKIG